MPRGHLARKLTLGPDSVNGETSVMLLGFSLAKTLPVVRGVKREQTPKPFVNPGVVSNGTFFGEHYSPNLLPVLLPV